MRTVAAWALLLASFIGVSVSWASEPKPECVHVGTPSEGWMYQGEMISLERCSEKVLVCGGVGEMFEHYWAVSLKNPEDIVRTRCSQPDLGNEPPACTPDGWLFHNHLVRAECEGRLLRCEKVGTPDEGWRAYGVQQISFLGFARCSSDQ